MGGLLYVFCAIRPSRRARCLSSNRSTPILSVLKVLSAVALLFYAIFSLLRCAPKPTSERIPAIARHFLTGSGCASRWPYSDAAADERTHTSHRAPFPTGSSCASRWPYSDAAPADSLPVGHNFVPFSAYPPSSRSRPERPWARATLGRFLTRLALSGRCAPRALMLIFLARATIHGRGPPI